jgi:ribosome production factor 2
LFGSHNKKRPNNLVIGRTYENKILDMVELGMLNYEAIADLTEAAVPINVHPFLIFQGDVWETD